DDPPSALRARLLRATGSAHLQAGDFEAAQSHLQQVLDIPGEDRSLSSTRASAREMLAVVLSRRGRYEESVEQFSIARDELETVLGPEHPRVAKILGNLGSSLRQLGRLDESEEAIRRAIEINTEINGPQAEGIATLLHNLGILQRSKGDEQAARQTLERSIELMVQHRGPDHPSVGWVRNDLGTLVFLGGDYERSLPHLREAARIFELSQGDQAPGLVFTMATLIQNHLALEQPNQALPYVERGLAALEQRTAEPAAAGSLRFACALALWDAGQRPRAVSLGRLALADMNSSQRPVETHIETIGAWVTEHEAQVH
ncbi:MAG: tetratricopeptide repeat protein, partial [Deltaproteobacteria bacterium]|nr:tetratricopeptide repeat protein [Deltaproteobacteria bacterium]